MNLEIYQQLCAESKTLYLLYYNYKTLTNRILIGEGMNETIKTQLNHRSIRQFKPLALTQEEVDLLVDVARHTATSNFRQSYSIISITDETLKEEIAEIANQPYIPNAGHLFVFVVDQRRNTLIAEAKGADAFVQGSPERLISAFSDAMIAA